MSCWQTAPFKQSLCAPAWRGTNHRQLRSGLFSIESVHERWVLECGALAPPSYPAAVDFDAVGQTGILCLRKTAGGREQRH